MARFTNRTKGSKIIPETTLEKIVNNGGKIPDKLAEKVRKRGVLIVRNTIPEEETKEMMADLVKYLYSNNGFPKDPNQVNRARVGKLKRKVSKEA